MKVTFSNISFNVIKIPSKLKNRSVIFSRSLLSLRNTFEVFQKFLTLAEKRSEEIDNHVFINSNATVIHKEKTSSETLC